MRSTMEKRLGSVFACVFAILFLIGVIQCQMVANLANAHRKVARTGDMIQDLTLTERLLSDAQAAAIGYVMSGNAADLNAYNAAASEARLAIESLRKLPAEDGASRPQIERLASLTTAALDGLQSAADARSHGQLSSANALMTAETGRKTFGEARVALRAMEESQRVSLGRQNGSLGITSKLASIVTSAGSVVALWLLVLMGLVLRHYVSERRQNSRNQLLSVQLLDNMAAGVFLSDETGMILYANPAGHAMFGYEAGELIGHNLSMINEFASSADRQQFDEVHQQLISDGVWKGEIPGRRRDGSPFTCTVQVNALERGGKMHWISVEENLAESKSEEQPMPSITAESTAAAEAPGACFEKAA